MTTTPREPEAPEVLYVNPSWSIWGRCNIGCQQPSEAMMLSGTESERVAVYKFSHYVTVHPDGRVEDEKGQTNG